MPNKILSKLRNKHFLSLAGNAIMSLIGVVTLALLNRAMTIAEMGVWVMFVVTIGLVDTFRSGFLTTAFIKFYAGATDQRKAAIAGGTWLIAGSITGILLALNMLILLLYFTVPAVHNMVHDEGWVLFYKWFGITYVATLPSFIATCVVQSEQRFDQLLYIRFVSQAIFIIAIAALIHLKIASLQNVIYANLISSVITSAFTMVTGWARLASFAARTKEATAELFHFGKFSVGTTLSSNMFRTSDNYIISFMLGKEAIAIYNLGQRLMEIVEIPLRSFAATGMPELSAAYNQDDRKGVIYIMKKYIGILTIALIPAGILAVLLSDVAINIIGGEKYVHTEAANVLRIFMTFALLYPLDRFQALTLDVIHKPKINFIKVLIMLVFNITFDIAGVMLFKNIYGIALATIVPVAVGCIISFWALNKYEQYGIRSIFTVGYKELRTMLGGKKSVVATEVHP